MYYYTDDQNSCKKLTAQIPMKATIICLPPTLHTCQNVPAAIIKPSATDSDSSDYYDKNSGYSDNPENVATGTGRRGSCCHHWEHKNYDYEKYKPTTTTATPTRQHNHQKEKRYNKNQSSSNNNNSSTHHFGALRSRNCSNSTNRERYRNFYNLNENITSHSLMSKTPATSSQSALEFVAESESESPSWHCRTKTTESAKNAESTTKRFQDVRTSLSLSSSAANDSTSSSESWPTAEYFDLHHQMNTNEKLNLSNSCAELANDRSTLMTSANKNAKITNRNRKRNGNAIADACWNTNARLDDSFKLRTKQLVMPIIVTQEDNGLRTSENRLENIIVTVCEWPEMQAQMQTKFVTSNERALVKEMNSFGVDKSSSIAEGEWSATTRWCTYRSTIASTNDSQTTKTQFTSGGLCSRATNASDIQTHEVLNFVKWSDVDKGYANDGNNGSDDNYGSDDGIRNSKSDNSTRTNSIEQQKLNRNPNQKQQKQQQIPGKDNDDDEVGDRDREEYDDGGKQHATLSQHNAQSAMESLQRRRSYDITERQQLWQQMSVTLVMVVAAALQQHRHQVAKMLTTPATKFLLSTLMLLMLITTANCWAGRQDVPSNCTFPLRWEGSWFLSGYQQSIHIKGSQISYRGRCAASEGNKYLIVDEKGCHRCLVIYEKHENVLQYKESECEGDSMYMHQQNPSAMAMRSVLKQNGGEHRGGAHPNTNGHSRLSSSDQYIMRSNDDMNDYFCKGRETLQNLCDQIPGDALLYSLFRESAEPVKCPLKGPFIFTYNRGHGECKSPVSNIESCTEDSRLLLSFQACPDVQGTESTVEELTCLAAWKDGNSRYLVGLVSHHHAISNEERYRCFVYEKISSLMGGPSMITSKDAEYKLAQSGDATCNGLDSAEVGSRIMTLRKPPVAERCDFPVWFKGPRHWHALMGNAVYNYHTNDGSVHIIKSNGYMETRALCEQINKQTSTEMMAVVHYTTGCQSGFMCMMFYRRDTHVIEIQTGKQASRLEDACAPDHFDIHKMPYITLLASNPDPQICPMEGLYNLRGAIGPPYLTTRHKRNHNNKVHSLHGHHRFNDGFSSSGSGSATAIASVSGSGTGSVSSGSSSGSLSGSAASDSHKRRGTLSFRSSDRIEPGSWHANTRGLPVRSRRDAIATATSSINATASAAGVVGQTNDSTSNRDGKELLLRAEIMKSKDEYNTTHTTHKTGTALTLMAGDSTSTMLIAPTDLAMVRQRQRQRNRRDIPGCITNFKAQRQLWVGCTEPNVIDVRPLCNDEGDEEYYCHGSWTENTTVYIIARHKRTKHGVCISYRPTEGSSAKLVIGDACYRGVEKPPEHHLVANLSVFGKCGETGSDSSKIPVLSSWAALAVAIIATSLNSMRMISSVLLNADTDISTRR